MAVSRSYAAGWSPHPDPALWAPGWSRRRAWLGGGADAAESLEEARSVKPLALGRRTREDPQVSATHEQPSPGGRLISMAARRRTPPADPDSLIEVEAVTQPAARSASRRRHVLRTPHFDLEIHRENGRLFAKGEGIRAVVLKSPEVPSLGMLKRGIEGRVGERPLRIRRPRYGLRRRDRTIIIEGDRIRWHTLFRRHRHYDIVRSADDVLLYRRMDRRQFVNADASAEEVSVALVVAASGIIATSSLTFYLSL